MIGIGAGDCDPRWDEPEYECNDCEKDILIQDMFGEWFCPTCLRREQEEEAK